MSDMNNRGTREFSIYDAMDTAELEEILRLDAEAPEGEESDLELILYVMGVLAERRKRSGNFTGKTAQEAYESFIQNYLPEVEALENRQHENREQKTRPTLWLRRIAAAAAVLVLVLFGTMTAKAFGVDVWQIVATWAQETFSLGAEGKTEEPKTDSGLPYASLEEAMYSLELVTDLVPTWLPDGYTLDDLVVDENPKQKKYIAVYDNGNSRLKITIQSYLDSYPEQIEQTEGLVEIYQRDGIDYYLFVNYKLAQAAWINEKYECYMAGEISVDEMKAMIDSIGKD